MDAGVPISTRWRTSRSPVKEPGRFVLLTDIMGDEGPFGDMTSGLGNNASPAFS